VHRDLAARPWLPVAGTPVLPQHPVDALRAGSAASVPMIHGGTRDEARSHVAMAFDMAGRPVTAPQYAQVVGELFGADAAAVLREYPAQRYPSPGVALAAALSDEGRTVGACTQQQVVDAATEPVFAYEFAEPAEGVVGTVPMGAHHGVDVPAFFDSAFPGAPPPSRTAGEVAVAERMIGYWTAFAATGSPGPDWPAATGSTALQIDAAGSRPIDLAAAHRCAFWRSLPQAP
jgi:para-nitrobenzyl esterase